LTDGVVIRGALPADAATVSRIYIESWNLGFADLMPTLSRAPFSGTK